MFQLLLSFPLCQTSQKFPFLQGRLLASYVEKASTVVEAYKNMPVTFDPYQFEEAA